MLETKARVSPASRPTPAQDSTPHDVRIAKLEKLVRQQASLISRLEQDQSELRERVDNLP